MTLRAVLTGCGAMSVGWLEALTRNPMLNGRVELVGLVDLLPETAKARAQAFGLESAMIGSDLDAVLDATKPDLLFDVVVPQARRQVVETGLAHGCHVLTEKPMASSLEDARAMIAAAERAGRIHAVVQNRRYVAGVRRIAAFLASGAIGEATALHCDFFIGAHFGGFREEMQNVLLLDMAIHTFDAARLMSGRSAEAVYCHETNPRGSWYAHGAAANATFEMQDDVVFTYRGSWAAEGANTSWEGAWRFCGTRGTLLWDGADGFSARVVAGGEGFMRPLEEVSVPDGVDPRLTQGHASVISAFVDAVEAGTQPETVSSDNINSLAMVLSAIESARLHQRVSAIL